MAHFLGISCLCQHLTRSCYILYWFPCSQTPFQPSQRTPEKVTPSRWHSIDKEYQYLFAVNTISCVKSDSFFFYQPPLNLIEWALHPLCYRLPRRKFIKLNQYIVKATHLHYLVMIYCFERIYLRPKSVTGYNHSATNG